MNGNSEDYSRVWLNAIEEATACLNEPMGQAVGRGRGAKKVVESCLKYLTNLESILRQHDEDWDQLPSFFPPKFKGKQKQRKHSPPRRALIPSQVVHMEDNNPFAGFRDDEDEDDDEEDAENEAGDYPVLNLPSAIVMRRLMIRIVTAQSELYAHRANEYRNAHPPKWKLGAETLDASLAKVHDAIHLADSEISRLFSLNQQAKELAEDANVVEVAVQFLTKERDRYGHAAQQQELHLKQKLEPQWNSRDEARNRIGEDRWIHNPHPKNDYRQKRLQDEKQLRDVQAALAQLSQLDTNSLEQDSQQLQHRLLQEPSSQKQRYNGQRPTDLSQRVSLQDYPDPTFFGWTFTGSWDNTVEFFEMLDDSDGIIKLDWYFTTGTVKTSMDHPTQGKTQLFGSRVTPDIYVEVLQNPRTHTNVRYHTKPSPQDVRAFEDYGIYTA